MKQLDLSRQKNCIPYEPAEGDEGVALTGVVDIGHRAELLKLRLQTSHDTLQLAIHSHDPLQLAKVTSHDTLQLVTSHDSLQLAKVTSHDSLQLASHKS